METFILEVTLGVVATNLLNTVREAKNKAINFKAILSDLETTIIKLVPKVSRIEQLSEELGDLPKAEIQQLKLELGRATQLVSKCKEIAWWDYCNKHRYSNKLHQLRATLRRLIEMELPVGHAEDHMQILTELRNIRLTNAACFLLLMWRLNPGLKYKDLVERDGNGSSRISENGTKVVRVASSGGFKRIVLSASSWIISFFNMRWRFCVYRNLKSHIG
ncbi:hypothetical protein I3843_02G007000 [Carya illinoinensis]|uniref:RPW8 domain-containing protein n=1 Tax=Carya illinoinensis TaxID=32201 RepID=A0A8T1R764_CARIL|nr:hypothetical protein I3760_02G012100 [Carya illinoinensis]KAG6663210.1 hypothetical protein CIPAW_02G011200 [Carya illinoinensis]KAG7990053.1 hypothetical protein I3843_02G007000 [Carya illinoinensis]